MKIEGWKYYNHAVIPTCAPHEQANLDVIENGVVWKIDGGTPLLARWTSDYDCKEETSWWYIIKEAPFCVDEFSAKRRKNIRQSLKKCYVKKIDAIEKCEDIFEVYTAAFSKYKKADNLMSYQEFRKKCIENQKEGLEYWGGFRVEDDSCIGYMVVEIHKDYVETCVAKYHPDYLNERVSDAIHYTILDYYLNGVEKKYVSSGTRNINHITNAQKYKIENFGFRRAYCRLNIEYNPVVKPFVKILYPFRKLIKKLDFNTRIHEVISVLNMEEIARQSRVNE